MSRKRKVHSAAFKAKVARVPHPEMMAALDRVKWDDGADGLKAERAFLRELEGGCQVPIGVNSRLAGEELVLTGMVASLDGTRLIRDEARGPQGNPETIGIELARTLRRQGAGEILEEIFANVRPEA